MSHFVISIADFGTKDSIDHMLQALNEKIRGLKSENNQVTVVLNGDTYYPGFSIDSNGELLQTDLQQHYHNIFHELTAAGANQVVLNLGNHEYGLGSSPEVRCAQARNTLFCCGRQSIYQPVKGQQAFSQLTDKLMPKLKSCISSSGSYQPPLPGDVVQIADIPSAEGEQKNQNSMKVIFGDVSSEDVIQSRDAVEFDRSITWSTFSAGARQAFCFDSTQCYNENQYEDLKNYLQQCSRDSKKPLIYSHHPGPTECEANGKPHNVVQNSYRKAGLYSGNLWERFEFVECDDWSGKAVNHHVHVARVLARAVKEAQPDLEAGEKQNNEIIKEVDLIAGHVHGRYEEHYDFQLQEEDSTVRFNQYIDGTSGSKNKGCCGSSSYGFVIVNTDTDTGKISHSSTKASSNLGGISEVNNQNEEIKRISVNNLPTSGFKQKCNQRSGLAGIIGAMGTIASMCSATILSAMASVEAAPFIDCHPPAANTTIIDGSDCTAPSWSTILNAAIVGTLFLAAATGVQWCCKGPLSAKTREGYDEKFQERLARPKLAA